MTIINGWVDWAVRENVRQDKQYADPNLGLGMVMHSQEGYGLQAMRNIHNRDNPPSFMFWIAQSGALHQFAPVSSSVWCSGSYQANVYFWPTELEGVVGEPINDDQLRTAIRLIHEWETHTGRVAHRGLDEDGRNMWEHNEVAQRWNPNAGPTSCPSGRYDRLWVLLNGGDEPMTPEERARLEKVERDLKRLNDVLQARYVLARLAWDSDATEVEEAVRILSGEDA